MLWEKAASLAYFLQSHGCAGQRVLLVCKSQKHFVIAFFACLLAGCVAVPTAPPRRQALRSRLQLLSEDSRPAATIADSDEVLASTAALNGDDHLQIDMRLHLQGEDHAARAARWTAPALTDASPAFLQYTSGSTGDPKGVAVSHGNLMHNCAAIRDAMHISADSAILTALPLFHDMGLIGGVLVAMHAGCPASFLSPAEFVQHPERWLQIIAAGKITHSGGPNFMFDLATRQIRPPQMDGLDLSSWKVAFCGAEPIRVKTVAAFQEKFRHAGFQSGAFYPCYGMAECTLLVTGHRVGRPVAIAYEHGSPVIGCGVAAQETVLAIVDPDTRARVASGQVGEIWVSGSSVASGYWGRPALSAHTFAATLADADADGARYLRTGDLGFLRDGQLYVTGRLKELIIMYGKKYAPHDLEDEAERSHAALSPSGGAAFGVSGEDAERLVMVFEMRREWLHRDAEWAAIAGAMRTAVSAAHGVHLDDIVLIKPGALPRTSSGKVRRAQCRSDYLCGALDPLSARPEATPLM